MAAKPDEQELALLALIDAKYTRHPFYGSRKIKIYLRGLGHKINRKRVQRLMGIPVLGQYSIGRVGQYSIGANTSCPQLTEGASLKTPFLTRRRGFSRLKEALRGKPREQTTRTYTLFLLLCLLTP